MNFFSLAGAAGKLGGAIALRPWLIYAIAGAAAAALAGTYLAGRVHERNKWKASQVAAVQKARTVERNGAGIAHQAETDAIKARDQQLEKADATIRQLRLELQDVPQCRLPRRAVRVLDGAGVPKAPAAPTKPGGAAAPVAPDRVDQGVECTRVIENCAWNRVNVCEPNADQVERLQRFYEQLRQRYNR